MMTLLDSKDDITLQEACTALSLSPVDLIKQAEKQAIPLYVENDIRDLSILFSLGETDSYIDNDGNKTSSLNVINQFHEEIELGQKISLNQEALTALRLNSNIKLTEIDWSQVVDASLIEGKGLKWTFELKDEEAFFGINRIVMLVSDLEKLSKPSISKQSKDEERLTEARKIKATYPSDFNDRLNQTEIWDLLKNKNPKLFASGADAFWKAHKELSDKIFTTFSAGRPKGR